MLYLITTMPKKPMPKELLEKALVSTKRMIELEKEGVIKFSAVFVEGGGCMIIDVESNEEVSKFVMSLPTVPFCDVEVRALISTEAALENLKKAVET